jgi:hydroxyethylthiazole kinase
MQQARLAYETLEAVRTRAPLVHNITNYVAMDLSANLLLAAGASPMMAHAIEEVEDVVDLASVLVLNIGTPSAGTVLAMKAALTRAKARGIPAVLDPVGAGATPFRTAIAREILALGPSVLRGNASEILAIAGLSSEPTRGVETSDDSAVAIDAARTLAREFGCVVAVTGVTDRITDGEQFIEVDNGDLLMTRITALGCSLSALIGAFVAVSDDPLLATAHAIGVLGVVGELAAETADGPGSLRTAIIDGLYELDLVTLERHLRLRVLS